MELIIDRNKWLRGEGPKLSWLLRKDDGKMCCLGFLAKQLGAEDTDVLCYSGPINCPHVPWPQWFSSNGLQSKDCHNLMKHNDDTALTPQEREKRIIEIFAKHDITVKFV